MFSSPSIRSRNWGKWDLSPGRRVTLSKIAKFENTESTMADEAKSVLEFITKEATAKLLTDLVNISSPTGEEGDIARYLADRFENAGLKTKLQEADQDRYNAVGVLEGDGSGLSLLFNGHMDTTFTGREKVGLKGGYGLLPTVSSGANAVVGRQDLRSGSHEQEGRHRGF